MRPEPPKGAVTLDALATALVASGRATRATVPGLLYYVRGISLGYGRGPVFSGDLIAGPRGVACSWADAAPTGELPFPVDEVLDVFGAFGAEDLQAAIRVERPWRRARTGSAGADDAATIADFDLLAGFSQAFEWGEDVAHDLAIPVPAGVPEWALWLRIAMNVGRFEGHPWFDDAESRRIRLAIGLCEYPDGYEPVAGGAPGPGIG